MAPPNIKKASGNSASTTLSSSVSDSATSAPLTSDTNFSAASGEGMVIIGESTANEEFAYATGKTGSSLDIPLANRGLEGGAATGHNSGETVKGIITAGMWNDLADTFLTEHNDDGTHNLSGTVVIDGTASTSAEVRLAEDTDNGTNYMGIKATAAVTTSTTLTLPDGDGSANQVLATDGSGTLSWATAGGLLSTTQYAPEGFLINGKIVPSVASNNLTVAIKGMDGNDPSATNPVYFRNDNAVYSITSALSVTANAGTNWCNAGSAELATKEIDYFVYLGYQTTAGQTGVRLAFSRIPHATLITDFNVTASNEKGSINTYTAYEATDSVVNIGRFAATLSAGAGYTWTVPTFTATNLIQRPIFESRALSYVGTLTSAGTLPTFSFANVGYYQMKGATITVFVNKINTSGGTAGSGANRITLALPFAAGVTRVMANGYYANGTTSGIVYGQLVETGSTVDLSKQNANLNCADINDANSRELHMTFTYLI